MLKLSHHVRLEASIVYEDNDGDILRCYHATGFMTFAEAGSNAMVGSILHNIRGNGAFAESAMLIPVHLPAISLKSKDSTGYKWVNLGNFVFGDEARDCFWNLASMCEGV